jgi:hypothetical protein
MDIVGPMNRLLKNILHGTASIMEISPSPIHRNRSRLPISVNDAIAGDWNRIWKQLGKLARDLNADVWRIKNPSQQAGDDG